MSTYKIMTRLMLKFDLKDWSTIVFTFIFPVALLIVLNNSLDGTVPGVSLTGPITANVIAFGSAFVGIYAGTTHLALWRENGMLNVLRNFPLSANTILRAQVTTGTIFLVAQALVLFVVGLVLGMNPSGTAGLALIPTILGYGLFFFLGVLLAIAIPSMAGVSMAATILIIPMGFIGGAMMPIEMLPQWVQTIAPFTPLFHMREAIAMLLIHLGTWTDMAVGLAYLVGIGGLIGFAAEKLMQFK